MSIKLICISHIEMGIISQHDGFLFIPLVVVIIFITIKTLAALESNLLSLSIAIQYSVVITAKLNKLTQCKKGNVLLIIILPNKPIYGRKFLTKLHNNYVSDWSIEGIRGYGGPFNTCLSSDSYNVMTLSNN